MISDLLPRLDPAQVAELARHPAVIAEAETIAAESRCITIEQAALAVARVVLYRQAATDG